jgi:hypothetical protein
VTTELVVGLTDARPSRSLRARPSDLASRRLATSAWLALMVNVLPYYSFPALIAPPARVAQLVTQGALVVALLLALMSNPRVRLRPTLVMALLTVVCVVTLATAPHNDFFIGSTYRAVRLTVFVVVLWLLTPWWGRRDAPLLRAHLLGLVVITGSVVVGAVLSPGAAFSYGGRLSGALWAMPPTQVAHYAAVLLGCTVLLWMGRVVRSSWVLAAAVVCAGILVGSHTRTALLALVLGLAVGAASMFVSYARVRRTSVTLLVVTALGAVLFSPLIVSWLLRGQETSEAANLTGRTLVWSQVFAAPRPGIEVVFGSGPSNQSFNGLPIDSNWVASFLDLGYFGIAVQVAVMLTIVGAAVVRPRSPSRAIALFLVVYCTASSFTEVALAAPTMYLLDVAVAASLVLPLPNGERP